MLPLKRGAATWILTLLALLAACCSSPVLAADNNQRVVCYYTNWSVYRPGTAKFTPQNINPYLCTHLIYSFGGFTKENTLKPYDKYQDIEQGGFAKFTGLKTYNKNLKTLLAIGGWNEGSSRFSPLVADPERRSQFVRNAIKFLRQNHFDGLDLDWEYPAFRDGSKPKDRENYAQLVQELREEFERESSKTGRPRLLLTMAVPAGTEYVEKGYDVRKLNKYLDWFNLLTYDYHSAYEPAVNHHSPLFSLEEASEYNFDSELNIDYSVKFYLNAGADREKLVLGIPTYGRSYTLYNPDATDIGAPADGPGEQGDATREKGYLAYYEICSSLKEQSDWTVVQPNPKAMGPYAYKGNQWVGYDDEAIARRKAKYVAENGLGGIMFWSIDNDDFRGTCHGKPYPIIEAAKEALLASTDVGVNDIAPAGRPRKPSRSRSRPGSTSRNRVNTDNNNEIKASFKTSQGRKVARPSRITTTSTTTTTTTEGSLYIGGRTTTPQPPTTPDPGADFKCTDEGFFPHPRDCKKYFWCLDSPSLGLVAHQFTCPSGLVFNKLADSCDYARNVICEKQAPSTTPSTTTTTTTSTTTPVPPASTTQRVRITAATSRNTFFNRGSTTSTTTTTTAAATPDYLDEEEEDEEEEVQKEGGYREPEEDPKVIKELIALIKKVGGIEELEKQLQAQEDGSIVLRGGEDRGATDPVSTTPSTTISKSLYERVLSRTAGTVGQKFRPATIFTPSRERPAASTSPENKYSSVVRSTSSSSSSSSSSTTGGYSNSRVRPQNEGLDQLPEFEGVFREKPKYVTLNRVRPTKTTSIEDRYDEHGDDADDDAEEAEEEDDEIVEEENQPSTFAAKRPTPSATTGPKYVSIRRQRPTATTASGDGQDEPEPTRESNEGVRGKEGTGPQYATLNRNRFRPTSESAIEGDDATERTIPSRYNTIDRRRAPGVQSVGSRFQEVERDDVGTDSSLLVPSTDFQTIYTGSTTTITTTTTTTSDATTTTTPPPSELNSIPYSTRQYSLEYSNIVSGSSVSSDRGSSSSDSSNKIGSGTSASSDTERPEDGSPAFLTTSAPGTEAPAEQSVSVQQQQQQQLSPPPQQQQPSVANEIMEPTLAELTTVLNQGEGVADTSVGAVDEEVGGTTTSYLETSYVTPTTPEGGSPGRPVLTNDAFTSPNQSFKFTQRTRKPPTTTTTTTTTSTTTITTTGAVVPPVTNHLGAPLVPEVNGGGFGQGIKAAPRPFAAGVRRTRPTRPTRLTTTTTTTASPTVTSELSDSNTLRSVKVSYSKAQRFDLTASGRQRRVGLADSAEVRSGDADPSAAPRDAGTARPPTLPPGGRGRVRFRASPTVSPTGTPEHRNGSQRFRPVTTSPTDPSSSVAPPQQQQQSRRRSRPSLTGSLAASRFAIGRDSTTEAPGAALRRVNFELYSGRGTTTSTGEPAIETGPPPTTTTAEPGEIRSYTRLPLDDPFMTQERILLTLGTALRYGFSNRNELTTAGRAESVTEQQSSTPFKGRPFGFERDNMPANVADSAFVEGLNDMSTEPEAELPYTVADAVPTTVYSVDPAEVDTTTPQPRRPAVRTRTGTYRATTESSDTTLNVVVSEVNTNKTFIPGRITRPTRPARFRSSTTEPLGSTETAGGTEQTEAKASRRPFGFARRQEALAARFAVPDNELPGISTTKRQRGGGVRRRTTTTTTATTTSAPEQQVEQRVTAPDRRQRLFAARTTATATTTTTTTTTPPTSEPYTVEPRTYPDSNVANSDFTTVISKDASNEIGSTFDLLNTDGLLAFPEHRDDREQGSEEEQGPSSEEDEMVTPGGDTTLATPPSIPLTSRKRPEATRQRYNDSQQIESESISNRSPGARAFTTGAPPRRFTGRILTTEATEPTEPIRKFIPTRRNRPSFSLARNRLSSSTTEGADPAVTSATPASPVSSGSFVPTRRRKPFSAISGRTTTTATTTTTTPTPAGAGDVGEGAPVRTPPRRLSANRRPPTFVDSFDQPSKSPKPFEQRAPNRNSLLLPKRPQSFLRTTTTAKTTTSPGEGSGETTDRTTYEGETSGERYGYGTTPRRSSYERYNSGEDEQEDENEIGQRQGKRLPGSALGGSDASNALGSSGELAPGITGLGGVGFRRPPVIGSAPPRIIGSARLPTLGTGSNRFIFNNGQPAAGGEAAAGGSTSTTTQRTITTRTRRPFGGVGGYKPQLPGQNGTVGGAGSVTTPRPRFTPTTRTRAPPGGRQRSTTPAGAVEGADLVASRDGTSSELDSGAPTRRYQPRKPTNGRRNQITNTVPGGGGVAAGRPRTNPTALFGSGRGGPVAPLTTTEPTVVATSVPTDEGTAAGGEPETVTVTTQTLTTLLTSSGSAAGFTTDPLFTTTTTTTTTNNNNNNNNNNMNNNNSQQATLTSNTSVGREAENEIVEKTTVYPTQQEQEQQQQQQEQRDEEEAQEEQVTGGLNTLRTTTEYYTASDEAHYTTLNTADTKYTINDNIDIDDVHVLQDRGRTSTTTVKPTTLYHVFSIDKDNAESVPSSTEIYRTEEQEIELPAANRTDKLVQIHRVVEIYTKNASNPDDLPVMQKLGEINRKIIIRLVEPNRATNRSSSSSSSTTTTTTNNQEQPNANEAATATESSDESEKRARSMVLSSNSVFTVETSTIPLEGLFDAEQKSNGFPVTTTELPLPLDPETVAPQQEIERISSVEFGTVVPPAAEELPLTITPLVAETERYTLQVTSSGRPDALLTTVLAHGSDARTAPTHTTIEYDAGGGSGVTTTTDTAADQYTTTRAAPVASSTQREIVHKYTLPAEFSFQEPSSETTTSTTTTSTTTTTTGTPLTTQTPTTTTSTTTQTPETEQPVPSTEPVAERVRPLVLPSTKEGKRKYTKRPTEPPPRVPDFAYNREVASDSEQQLDSTTEPLTTDAPPPATSSRAPSRYLNGRKYVSSLSLRPNFGGTGSSEAPGVGSFRKSKDIPVGVPSKGAGTTLDAPAATTVTPTTRTTTTRTTTTRTTTTTPAPITKIDFNIKYVLPASLPSAGDGTELKIESKNDKYSVPLTPILRPDFVTREISGERQERQFSPVYRPDLDNDELTRQLTSDPDPVALEAAHLDHEILGGGGGDGVAGVRTGADLLSGESSGEGSGERGSLARSAAFFLRRSAEVRPQFRPSLRRPAGEQQPAASTTTVRTKTTRRSASSEEQYSATTSQPPTSSSSLLSRRRRPTAPSYLSKLANANRLATATVTSLGEQSTIGTVTSTTASATTTTATTATATTGSKFSRPKPAGASSLRRKYGGGVRTGSNTGATSTSSGDSVTPQPDPIEPATRATNTLFRRRNSASPLTRTTTTTTVASAGTVTGSPVSDKFFGKSKYSRPAGVLSSVKLTAPSAPVSDADQHIEPSIRQNSKLSSSSDNDNDSDGETKGNARFQQIGEPNRVSVEQELLLDAITTISRAPLPLTSTTTTRNNVEATTSVERTTEHQVPGVVHVEQQGFPARANQRATTHKYNITHQYPYPLGYTEPITISTSTRRSQKLIQQQQPRIATHSQSYYQQAEYKHYSHPLATATIHPRQDTPASAVLPRKTKPPPASGYNGPYESGRKHPDDNAGRPRTSPIDYDYYDDDNARVIGKSTSQVKVIMHGPGIIECLDQGNFPHPLSCKKFISCAKMEIGGVIGWEYICPKGLSYDPVGGICNWSAGLGCKD